MNREFKNADIRNGSQSSFWCLTLFGIALFFNLIAEAGIVKKDGRLEMSPEIPEVYKVGMFVNVGGICSATLVSKRLAITNRHCLFDSTNKEFRPQIQSKLVWMSEQNHGYMTRTPGQMGPAVAVGIFNNHPRAIFEVQEIWWGSTVNHEDDWAILILAENNKESTSEHPALPMKLPGEIMETFTLAKSGWVPPMVSLSHAGYTESYFLEHKTGHIQTECQSLGQNGVLLFHDCSNGRGASGGGLWVTGTNELVAINAYEECSSIYVNQPDQCEKNAVLNGALSVDRYRLLVEALIKQGN